MNVAIVLSGGVGSRLGTDIPKQYIEVQGKPVVTYSLETLDKDKHIDELWIVAEEEWVGFIRDWANKLGVASKLKGFSKPGANRQLSIYNALVDLNNHLRAEDYVFIHDAARPLLSEALIARSFEEIAGADGVIPVVPMKDTVYKSEDGKTIASLLEREKIFGGQAPETFVYGKYLEANQVLVDSGEIVNINGSTEPAIKFGMKIKMIEGEEANYKITTKEDLRRFEESIRG